jgi:hypothetical protein
MQALQPLDVCEQILKGTAEQEGQDAEIKRRVARKLDILSRYTMRLCELAASEPAGGDALLSFDLMHGTDAVFRGLDVAVRVLRQVQPDLEPLAKEAAALRRGAYRELLNAVSSEVSVDMPVSWVMVPTLRDLVTIMKSVTDLCV